MKLKYIIYFHLLLLLQIANGNDASIGQYVMIEPYLDGCFRKFNSNGGWEDADERTMNALTHFSFVKSQGNFVLCDLQGIPV